MHDITTSWLSCSCQIITNFMLVELKLVVVLKILCALNIHFKFIFFSLSQHFVSLNTKLFCNAVLVLNKPPEQTLHALQVLPWHEGHHNSGIPENTETASSSSSEGTNQMTTSKSDIKLQSDFLYLQVIHLYLFSLVLTTRKTTPLIDCYCTTCRQFSRSPRPTKDPIIIHLKILKHSQFTITDENVSMKLQSSLQETWEVVNKTFETGWIKRLQTHVYTSNQLQESWWSCCWWSSLLHTGNSAKYLTTAAIRRFLNRFPRCVGLLQTSNQNKARKRTDVLPHEGVFVLIKADISSQVKRSGTF